jgi:hypothetical protein
VLSQLRVDLDAVSLAHATTTLLLQPSAPVLAFKIELLEDCGQRPHCFSHQVDHLLSLLLHLNAVLECQDVGMTQLQVGWESAGACGISVWLQLHLAWVTAACRIRQHTVMFAAATVS